MDAAEPGPGSAAGVTLVKAEISDHLAGTSAATSTPGTTGASPAPSAMSPGLFTGSSNKRPRTDDWLSPTSPGSPQSQKHLVYTTPQQQINSQQPPLAHSTPLGQTQQAQSQPPNNNGYASPMSSGSYDPYSPNGKIGREDLSPPSSLNGYNANSCDAKKKKGPTPRQQEELCLVCGDRASGYHYNALTCEGCKGFFRRSITKNAVYQCKYGSGCEIDMYMRRKCQECRLKKCLKEGMRPECVVPEYQCAVKRKEKKAQKEKDKPNSTTMNGSPMSLSGSGIEHVSVKTEPMETDSLSSSSNRSVRVETTNNGIKPLSPEQEQLINRVVYFQTVFEHPNQEDVKNIIEQLSNVTDPSDHNYKYITEITMLTVNLVVQFAMRLPGFDQILREDQIALLKASSSEVMMLRMARKYDINTDSIIFANNQSYTKDSYITAGLDESIEDLLQFCRQMYTMQVNNAEYALLTAAVIFSERPNLMENKKIEMIQEIYLEALKAYVDNRRKQRGSMMFPKLLSVLTELRTLGYKNSETCDKLKLKNKQLPPFLAEIWDK